MNDILKGTTSKKEINVMDGYLTIHDIEPGDSIVKLTYDQLGVTIEMSFDLNKPSVWNIESVSKAIPVSRLNKITKESKRMVNKIALMSLVMD